MEVLCSVLTDRALQMLSRTFVILVKLRFLPLSNVDRVVDVVRGDVNISDQSVHHLGVSAKSRIAPLFGEIVFAPGTSPGNVG